MHGVGNVGCPYMTCILLSGTHALDALDARWELYGYELIFIWFTYVTFTKSVLISAHYQPLLMQIRAERRTRKQAGQLLHRYKWTLITEGPDNCVN